MKYKAEVLLERVLIPDSIKKIIRRPRFRKKLYEKCGPSAFLDPEDMKFPVKTSKCKYHCGMIYAAYIRAKEWGYEDIAKKAKELFEKNGCAEKLGIHIRGEE